MKQAEKLDYLNGLKVLACLMIFNFHFVNFFYPGEYSLLPEHFHTQSAEYIMGASPLNIIAGGKFGVKIFMTLSGFFVGYRFFITGEKKSLKAGVIKKYFRLVLPITVVSILIFILMSLGLYKNAEAAESIGSVFVCNYNTFSPSLFGALKEALWGCFVTGANAYNGPLWFIYYEFFGTLLIAAILSLLGESRARYIAYAVAAMVGLRTDFLPFIFGTIVCDLTYQPPKWVEKLSEQKWLMWLLLLAGLFLGSFPPIGERMEGTIYQFFPLKIMPYYIFGASMVLYALLHLKAPAKLLSWKPLTWFFPFTYSFYLLHFVVLCTFSGGFYLLFCDRMNYHVLALLNFILTFLLTTVLSWLLHRFVEKPGMKLANRIGGYFEVH